MEFLPGCRVSDRFVVGVEKVHKKTRKHMWNWMPSWNRWKKRWFAMQEEAPHRCGYGENMKNVQNGSSTPLPTPPCPITAIFPKVALWVGTAGKTLAHMLHYLYNPCGCKGKAVAIFVFKKSAVVAVAGGGVWFTSPPTPRLSGLAVEDPNRSETRNPPLQYCNRWKFE